MLGSVDPELRMIEAFRASSVSRLREGVGVRALPLRKIGMTAGAVVLGLVALDLIATAATLALGWGVLRR